MPSLRYRGRFAPTSSGELHLGSILAALASYLDAKKQGGTWLVRIEDTDLGRCKQEYSCSILKTLERFNLFWDEEVVYQSNRTSLYDEYLQCLLQNKVAFFCTHSRHNLPLINEASVRFKAKDAAIEFVDQNYGKYSQNVNKKFGDFVIKSSNGYFAYIFASVIDDFLQGVTKVVRGSDLLDITPRQILLQQTLNFTTPTYLHIPVILNAEGEKLSKQTKATPVNIDACSDILVQCLNFLGQNPPTALRHETPASILKWAIEEYDPKNIPTCMGKTI